MYRIIEKETLSEGNRLMDIDAPDVARKTRAGQFVMVRVDERGERIPLTVADYDRDAGTVTIVFQEVGKTTMHLGTLEPGDELATFTGPLGHPTDIQEYGTVICVGGGVGIAPIFPIARALRNLPSIRRLRTTSMSNGSERSISWTNVTSPSYHGTGSDSSASIGSGIPS